MLFKRALADLRGDDVLRKYINKFSEDLNRCTALCKKLEDRIYTGTTLH